MKNKDIYPLIQGMIIAVETLKNELQMLLENLELEEINVNLTSNGEKLT